MAVQTTVYPTSPHIEREARKLLALRDRWISARNRQTGVAFVAIPSPCGDRRCPAGPDSHEHVRHVQPLGLGCDCPAVQDWGSRICKHMQAVRLANAEQSAAQAAPVSVPTHGSACLTDRDAQDVNDAIMDRHRAASRYDVLFPRCRAVVCTELSDTADELCDRHAAEIAYAERLASKRAAPRETVGV